MQSSYLQNPRPSDGYRNVVAGAKMTSGIAMPTIQSLQQPSIHNNVKEPMVNSTASYPIFVRPYSRASDFDIRRYTECTPLFINKYTSKKELQNNSMMRQVLSLSDLNKHIQQCRADNKDQLDEWQHSYEKEINKDNIFENVVKTWAFYGVVRNEMDHADYFGSTSHNGQLLLNCDVRGRSRVDNVWGRHVKQGDKLYYLIKKNPVKTNEAGIITFKSTIIGLRNFDSNSKRGETMFGTITKGDDDKIIYLGMVGANPIRPTDLKTNDMFDADRMRASSKVEVFLGI